MRTSRRLRAMLPAALLACLAYSGTALADEPVGGALMGAAGTVVSPGAPPFPKGITASSWLVADLDSGAVLAAHDAHGRFAPASTLKTLTALTLIPRLAPDRKVAPVFEDLNVDGTKVGLVEKVGYPVRELFTALLVVSGNDAAMTLADADGGVPTAVAEMNEQARRVHADDTHADNPSGLDAPGQVSSAYDLALIARAGMRLPDFRSYVATKYSTISAPGTARLKIANHDKLLYNYPGAIGIKNGYTVRAQASMVGAATRNGHTLVVTLMHAQPRIWPEAAKLLDWGFAATAAGLAPVGQLVEPRDESAPAATSGPRARLQPLAVRAATATSGPALVPWGALAGVAGAGVLVALRRRRRNSSELPW